MKGTALLVGIVCSTVLTGNAQTISVDMDPDEGIQDAFTATDTAETLAVTIRITGADNLFSYQCKVVFDTGSFSFLAAQQDFGMSGEKNILTNNCGSVIGIYEQQTNPPAADTVTMSGSITGTDASLSVDGDGCIGVLYLQSKLRPGNSASITVVQGFLAQFGEDLIPVDSYDEGIYTIDPSVPAIDREDRLSRRFSGKTPVSLLVAFPESDVQIGISGVEPEGFIAVTLLTLDGKTVIEHRQTLRPGTRLVTVRPANHRYAPGTYLCAIRSGNDRFSRTVRFR